MSLLINPASYPLLST